MPVPEIAEIVPEIPKFTRSAAPGYGQKQADDVQHSNTGGKVTESVDWSTVTETTEHGNRTYKIYLIAVVYNCG